MNEIVGLAVMGVATAAGTIAALIIRAVGVGRLGVALRLDVQDGDQ